VLLFFSVARSAQTSQAERANEANPTSAAEETPVDNGEKITGGLLTDVSPQALRMSSPFNAGYWLDAA
jgi:hypothetical protein